MNDRLPEPLLDLLSRGCAALVLTVGADGFPNTAYSWAIARDNTSIRFCADDGSETLANLYREQCASLQIIGPGNIIYLIKGSASQTKPQIEATPFRIAMLTLHVKEAKDQSWPGVSVRPLIYDWEPEQRREMLAMEQNVYSEMRHWVG